MGYSNNSTHPLAGGATIDFNFQPAHIYKQKKKIDFHSYCGSCSDSTGNLLFYTNGISIQNHQHELMQGGDSLNLSGFWYEFQQDGYPVGAGARIVPAPGKPNQYYLFSMGGRYEASTNQLVLAPLWYSRIDMNQNGGLGRVMEKNVVMLDVPLNEFVFVKHGNGRDWWLLASRLNKNLHYTFLINEDGVNGPFVQEFGPPYTELETPSFCSVSPDGQTYIREDTYKGLNIYDFDRCTGQLSNLRQVPFEAGFACLTTTFSPDGRFLYLNSYEAMLSMDMHAPDPPLTLDTLAYFDGFSTPEPFITVFWTGQAHDDGKLYYATGNGTLALHVIHHPELPGLAADIEQHAIKLPVYNSLTLCRFPNYRLGILTGSACDTIPFTGGNDAFRNTANTAPLPSASTGYKMLSPIRGNGTEPASRVSVFEYDIDRMRRIKREKLPFTEESLPQKH